MTMSNTKHHRQSIAIAESIDSPDDEALIETVLEHQEDPLSAQPTPAEQLQQREQQLRQDLQRTKSLINRAQRNNQ